MNTQPIHIERAEVEIREMFTYFRGVNDVEISRYLGLHPTRIDIELAWEEFNALAFRALFTESSGDAESMADPIIRKRIMSRIRHEFIWRYYTSLLANKGILDSIEVEGTTTFFFRGTYKESINILFSEASAAVRS